MIIDVVGFDCGARQLVSDDDVIESGTPMTRLKNVVISPLELALVKRVSAYEMGT